MYRAQMKNSACVGCVHLLNVHLEAPFSRYISFLNISRFLFAFELPRDQFQIFGLENFDGPLCTGGCKKLVYMAEILVTLSVLREPARIFLNKMCSFDVTDFEKTLLVTL